MMYFSNNRIFQIFFRGSLILLLFYLCACSSGQQTKQYTLTGQTMGTSYHIKIIHSQLDDKKLDEIQTEIDLVLKVVNQQMSTYIPDSEISKFNNFKSTNEFQVSDEFFKVLRKAVEVYNLSDGAFDITVNPLVTLWGFGNVSSKFEQPNQIKISQALKQIGTNNLILIDSLYIKKQIPELQIDLSAIAKGYGVDAVAKTLNKINILNYMVEIGGEVLTKGLNLRGLKWGIGVDKPTLRNLTSRILQDTLYISNIAVATSGDYRNFFEYENKIYSHTINPKTGYPVTHHLASATILAPTCMEADAIATAVMVMGVEEGLKLLESLENVEGLLIERLDEGKFKEYQTVGFEDYSQSN